MTGNFASPRIAALIDLLPKPDAVWPYEERRAWFVLMMAAMDDAYGDPLTPAMRAKILRSIKGPSMGGLARAAALSPERRSEIASDAAKARWDKP